MMHLSNILILGIATGGFLSMALVMTNNPLSRFIGIAKKGDIYER